MIEFLRGWGTLIVAALALAQPWLIRLWNKVFRPGTIDIYESGKIEVGFSRFGGTIGLQGTLRAVFHDQFVRGIHLKVIKRKNKAEHIFDWGFFRVTKFSVSGLTFTSTHQEVSLEAPSGFLLSVGQPRHYNIQFHDTSTQAEITEHLRNFSDEWLKAIRDAGWLDTIQSGLDIASLGLDLQTLLKDTYKEFRQSKGYIDTYTYLDRLLYWEEGDYELYMNVDTARPEKAYTKLWSFKLSDSDIKNLRVNVINALDDLCGQRISQYFFALVDYQEVTLEG